MAVTPDKPGPYAPASAVLDLVNRHRDKGLPMPVTAEVLERAGISPSLIPRTIQTLQALDLIDENGSASQVLEGIRLSPESEYQRRLLEWLNAAYADALQYIDPATATETNIRDAFRKYNPTGQQSRMVSLFVGLYRAAGVLADKGDAPARKSSPSTARRRAAPAPAKAASKSAGKPGAGAGFAQGPTGNFPPALAGLLTSLPDPQVGWTQHERDRFVQTLSAVLDFCYPIHADAAGSDEHPEPEEDEDAA